MPSSDIVWSQHPLTAFLKNVDASGNACPSLHVAFAVFTLGWLHRLLHEMGAGLTIKTVNWLWCAAIVYSTIATRQHVVLDVVAGAALGAIIVTANLLWLRRAELRPSVSQPPKQINIR
jgi:membrane-associated phospholipid phosphatase